MGNALSTRIREITIQKMDLQDDVREGHLKSYANATLDLDDAGDEFVALSGGDADQEEIANALVDLADIFDDAKLTPSQSDKLDSVVDRLLKTGTPEQKAGAKNLFKKTLAYGLAAKAENEYFDTLLATEPPEEN